MEKSRQVFGVKTPFLVVVQIKPLPKHMFPGIPNFIDPNTRTRLSALTTRRSRPRAVDDKATRIWYTRPSPFVNQKETDPVRSALGRGEHLKSIGEDLRVLGSYGLEV